MEAKIAGSIKAIRSGDTDSSESLGMQTHGRHEKAALYIHESCGCASEAEPYRGLFPDAWLREQA